MLITSSATCFPLVSIVYSDVIHSSHLMQLMKQHVILDADRLLLRPIPLLSDPRGQECATQLAPAHKVNVRRKKVYRLLSAGS